MNKEEYEFVAKAAGYDIKGANRLKSGNYGAYKKDGDRFVEWDAQANDEDAFRLMVDADIVPRFDVESSLVWAEHEPRYGKMITTDGIFYGDDKRDAFRKSIWDCAAEIGRSR